MVERRLTVSQARGLLRLLSERSKTNLLRLGQEISGPTPDVKMAALNSPLTYRMLDYYCEHEKVEDPRIRLRLYESNKEVAEYDEVAQKKEKTELGEQTLERRASEAAHSVADKAEQVANSARGLHEALSERTFSPAEFRRPEVKATLKEMEKALRQFKVSTEVAVDEYLGNRNPFVLELIREHNLDAEGARHGLRIAAFATELATNLGHENFLGRIDAEEVFGRLSLAKEDHDYSPEGLILRKEELFKNELVELFLGGFLHDAGLWGNPVYAGHEERGAALVSEIPRLHEISESLVDIILFHSDLEYLATHEGIVRSRVTSERERRYEKEFYRTIVAAEESLMVKSGDVESKRVVESDLRKILPVAIAEHFVSQSEDRASKPIKDIISSVVAYADGGIYANYMVVLCNSQAKVVAPLRSLVSFEGRIPAGSTGKKRLMELDGDVGVSVGNEGWRAPNVIRILKKAPDGGLDRLESLPPAHPNLVERTDPDCFMYVPVGRMGNLSVTVIGILGKEAYKKNFHQYEDWVGSMT